MNCPKCDKKLSPNVKAIEDDGGLILEIKCDKCSSVFESFVNVLDFEEKFDLADKFD